MKTKSITFRLTDRLDSVLREMAEKQNKTLTEIMQIAITNFLVS